MLCYFVVLLTLREEEESGDGPDCLQLLTDNGKFSECSTTLNITLGGLEVCHVILQ